MYQYIHNSDIYIYYIHVYFCKRGAIIFASHGTLDKIMKETIDYFQGVELRKETHLSLCTLLLSFSFLYYYHTFQKVPFSLLNFFPAAICILLFIFSIFYVLFFSQAQKYSVQFISVSQSCPTLCDPMNRSTPGLPVHHQLPEFTPTHAHRVVMPSSHLILCRPLLLLPPIPPSIRDFSNESTLRMRCPKYWSFSFSISPSNGHPGLNLLQDGLVGSPCSPPVN